MDEQLEVMRAAWTQERVHHDGAHYRFADVSVTPKPVQPGGPPILVGGNSTAALRRAARYGDGWHALMLLPDEIVEHRARLRAIASEAGRTDDLPVTICLGLHLTRDASVLAGLDHGHRQAAVTGTPAQVVDQLVAYRDVGVEHVQLIVSADTTFGTMSPVDAMAFVLREVWPGVVAA
jgi:alkanesulfonate monooxygenase SsuD/methylene tetrahydromethanopterin reductase-like flavin-dependent oxidoreductase (luciferase family)